MCTEVTAGYLTADMASLLCEGGLPHAHLSPECTLGFPIHTLNMHASTQLFREVRLPAKKEKPVNFLNNQAR